MEQWRDVKGYEGLYKVSDQGRVLSVPRQLPQGHTIPGRMKQQTPDEYGRPRVFLYRDGKQKTCRVHKLVLEAFVGECPPGMECCHLNDIKTDNRLENLRWDTRSANQIDRVRNKRNYNSNKTHCPRGHEFVPGNLIKSMLPGRSCLACNRARAYHKRHQHLKFEDVANWYYEQILGSYEHGSK